MNNHRKELVKRGTRKDEETLRKPERKSSRVISILPYRWNEKDIDQLLKECETMIKTGTTHLAFSSSMAPENMDDPYRKADALSTQFRKIRSRIKDNVKVGFLIQSTLGHGRLNLSLKEIQEVVSLQGVNTHRFCPLDRNFKKYIGEAIKRLCMAEPDFLLVDDDFRLLLGHMGCFCPEHLKRFAGITGRKYTRKELEKILNQTDHPAKGSSFMPRKRRRYWPEIPDRSSVSTTGFTWRMVC